MKALIKEQLIERSSQADLAIPLARPTVSAEELAAVEEVFESNWLGSGSRADRFATEVAARCGAAHVVAVNSGTAALHAAVAAIGLSSGDEVLVPSMTFVSTIQAIVATGATPVFCEVMPATLNIDVEDAARRVTSRTRAILPVHYGGEACDLSAVARLAASHGLRVIEDAAHAFGSSYQGRPIGSHGDVVCFSFDPIKNITCGLGGAAVTSDAGLAKALRSITNVGIEPSLATHEPPGAKSYSIASEGLRYRMSDINAAIGLVQLTKMDVFRRRKTEIAARYDLALAGIPQISLLARDSTETFPFSYVLRVTDGSRDQLIEDLRERGIGSAVQFTPNHMQPFFADYAHPLPQTELLFGEIVNLPFFPSMADEEVETVIAAVGEFFDRGV